MNKHLEEWHRIVQHKDWEALGNMLAEDATFHSPFAWTPKEGRRAVQGVLATVCEVFQDFQYHRQWVDDGEWALEFSAKVSDLQLKGLDLVTLNDQGIITRFEVLIRPVNALQALGAEMGRRLAAIGIS
ncbi:MAG: nuclear transport factor 2 family protein [Acidobacteriota bacterium]|nr:nuclear transport factor 2 family protein [Acidobacteriota bacterium]